MYADILGSESTSNSSTVQSCAQYRCFVGVDVLGDLVFSDKGSDSLLYHGNTGRSADEDEGFDVVLFATKKRSAKSKMIEKVTRRLTRVSLAVSRASEIGLVRREMVSAERFSSSSRVTSKRKSRSSINPSICGSRDTSALRYKRVR